MMGLSLTATAASTAARAKKLPATNTDERVTAKRITAPKRTYATPDIVRTRRSKPREGDESDGAKRLPGEAS